MITLSAETRQALLTALMVAKRSGDTEAARIIDQLIKERIPEFKSVSGERVEKWMMYLSGKGSIAEDIVDFLEELLENL